jgi:hypothetical protein
MDLLLGLADDRQVGKNAFKMARRGRHTRRALLS